jgi:hypothetical protein
LEACFAGKFVIGTIHQCPEPSAVLHNKFSENNKEVNDNNNALQCAPVCCGAPYHSRQGVQQKFKFATGSAAPQFGCKMLK